MKLENFKQKVFVDFEFQQSDGDLPKPICLVATILPEGKTMRIWEDELKQMTKPPYGIGDDTLVVAYYASAEMGCHKALSWELPMHVLDLYTEFRCLTNGKQTPCGCGVIGALAYFGLDTISATEKESMRNLALRGGPWTEEEKQALLDYCEGDVKALVSLFPKLLEHIDLPQGLHRGRYMKAAACIEHTGVPIDTEALANFRENWEAIKAGIIQEVDKEYSVFEGQTFKQERFAQYLAANDIPWPRTATGKLALDDDTFRSMTNSYGCSSFKTTLLP